MILAPMTGKSLDTRWPESGRHQRAQGMDFQAGPVRKEGSHAVLWTKESFQGNIRLDYEYTKLDDAIDAVTILYLQATGSGAAGYDKDISKLARQTYGASDDHSTTII